MAICGADIRSPAGQTANRSVASSRLNAAFKFRVAGPAQGERLSFPILPLIRGVSLSTN
jgi:hypothetical protein